MTAASDRAAQIAAEDGYIAQPDESEMTMAETYDATPEEATTTAGFDLAAWIGGARPVRRGTTVYARPDLLAEADILAERIAAARATGEDENALAEAYNEAAEAVKESALDVIVEARSVEARKAFMDECDALGMDETDRNFELVASHIVEPEGFTGDMLKTLMEVSEVQAAKIIAAVNAANSQAPSVPVPFSPGSSPSRGGRMSSGR